MVKLTWAGHRETRDVGRSLFGGDSESLAAKMKYLGIGCAVARQTSAI